jgi:hypothetical protein
MAGQTPRPIVSQEGGVGVARRGPDGPLRVILYFLHFSGTRSFASILSPTFMS